jgi:D-xylose transport system substrate-binding protein
VKLVTTAALLAGLMAGLVACRPRDAGRRGPKVAFLLATLQEERYQNDKRYFEDAARALGCTPFTLSADNDNARQLSQVEDSISRGARTLVIQPTDSAAAAAYVDKAHERGVKVLSYDRGIRESPTGAPDAQVAHDSFHVGVLQAEAAVKATGGRGTYVLLDGQAGHSVAMEIARGYHSVLDPLVKSGALKIATERNHDSWSPEQALKSVEDALAMTRGDVQAILCNNSGMARGAVQALEAAGKKGVFVAGADADAANVAYVCQGKQSVEVLKAIRPLAERAAQLACALAKGQPPGDAKAGTVAVTLVTRENARRLLAESGVYDDSTLTACR